MQWLASPIIAPIYRALPPLHTIAQRLKTSLGQKYLLLRGTIDVLEYKPKEVHKCAQLS